jgi:hypothetical protein
VEQEAVMIRVFLAALAATFLLLSNSNAGPFLLPERTLPTCRGGSIEHVVASTGREILES